MKALHLVEQMAPIDVVISSFHKEYASWISNCDVQEKLTTEVLTYAYFSRPSHSLLAD